MEPNHGHVRHDYWIRPGTNLQNGPQPLGGHEPGGNALVDGAAHSDGPEVIEIDVSDKAAREVIIDGRHCDGWAEGKLPSVSTKNRSQALYRMTPYRKFQALPET